MRNVRRLAVASGALLFLGVNAGVALAFNGPPPGSPPTGNGSIVTNVSNNVGIGTTNPGSRLTVRNSSAGTVFAIRNTADTANTFAVSDTGAITAGSLAWSLLTNFPAGCPAGQAVQTISGTPSCIAVGTGTVTSVSGSGGATGLTLTGGPITTSGTLTIGGTLAATSGGTAQSTYAAGDLLYASAANTLARRIIGSAGQVLTVSGGVPVWAAPSAGTVTSVSGSGGTTGLTLSGGPITTSGTLTVGGTLTAANGGTGLTSPGVSGNVLTSNGVGGWTSSAPVGDISGVTAGTGLTGGGATGAVTLNLAIPVAVTNGGTAQSTYAAGDLLYASAANTLARRIIGTAGQVLTVSGGVPAWTTPSAGTVTSVSGSGGTTGLTLSGGPITTSGMLTIGGTLTAANGGTGLTSPGVSGNVLTSNGVGGWTSSAPIGDISDVTAGTGLTGGGTSGAVTLNLAIPVAVTNGGTAQTTYATGDLLFASAANMLGKRTIGSAGQVLTVSGGVPAWATPATGVGGSGTANNIAKFTGASTVGNSQLVDTGTNVGLGVTAPNELLEVAAAGGARAIVSDGGGATRYYLLLQSPTAAQTYARVQSYRALIGAQNLILQDSGGNVGVGTVSPAQKLDVAGTVQSTGFKLTTGAVNGYVLKSDAIGVGTWQVDTAGTVTSVSGSGGTTGLTLTGGPITTFGTLTIGGTLAVANGGTGASTAAGARTNLGAAASGANSDITSFSGLTTPLSPAQGGTGQTALGAANQILGVNSTGATSEYKTLVAGSNVGIVHGAGSVTISASAGGETNTASNVGVSGVGVFKQKTGVNLELKNINAGSGRVSVANDAANNEVDVDVVESALTHDSIGGTLGVAKGGTGAITSSGARTNLGAAASGANSDITSLSGLTTTLLVTQGGTGAVTLPANNVLLGNDTAAVQSVAPGTSGNVLTSNGTTWVSQSPTGTFSSYEIVSAGSTGDASSFTPIAMCSAGKKVMGGGCTSGAPTVCRVTHSYPNTNSSWYCAEYHYEAAAICGYTQAWAICM